MRPEGRKCENSIAWEKFCYTSTSAVRVQSEHGEDREVSMRQRTKPRLGVRFPVQFLGDATVGKGALVNLSGPGCAVATQTPLSPGCYVSLQIKVPKHRRPLVIAVAQVRWAKDGQFGLEFIRYGNGGKEQLAQLLQEHRDSLLIAETEEDTRIG